MPKRKGAPASRMQIEYIQDLGKKLSRYDSKYKQYHDAHKWSLSHERADETIKKLGAAFREKMQELKKERKPAATPAPKRAGKSRRVNRQAEPPTRNVAMSLKHLATINEKLRGM